MLVYPDDFDELDDDDFDETGEWGANDPYENLASSMFDVLPGEMDGFRGGLYSFRDPAKPD